MKLVLLFAFLALVFAQNRPYTTQVTGEINGPIEKVWEKIGRFDKIEWWNMPFRVEGPRGIGQVRYQFPPGLTLKDIKP